ncbi:electron transport complex subunit RsxD [Caldichromatium japonicum]|uniref:Ion-translocating oxidoreductase complex subunit D n=1 Tax=Caldichromatium japonicum TaxID=2699430 RepID=A0A6G7VCL9_9GAMM|nr:electron transport complex subunit RsxD [Caldichromatium japonicum]QIK37823.1 electron transport complex subunit RsxD [Caldichromatium japonicum]
MTQPIISSPHVPRINRVNRVMAEVLVGLIPGVVALTWVFGWGTLINIALASLFAVMAESAVMLLRRRSPWVALRDLSALVTAALFAIAVPPSLPWWLTLLGIVFAIVIVKQLYGGLGYNSFNPAMAAYVFLLISYPVAMTAWIAPEGLGSDRLGFADSLQLILTGTLPQGLHWDAISSATPLDHLRGRLDLGHTIDQIAQGPTWGILGGHGWEWVNLGFLIGGIYLLARRIITWHVPIALLIGLAALSTLFWAFAPQTHASPWFHLFSGATMLGAFFIATDPVTGCTTQRGQIIFGACIGAIVYIIRTWGGYPDAIAFAVLLMNIAAPMIDYYTQPRVFGHGSMRL